MIKQGLHIAGEGFLGQFGKRASCDCREAGLLQFDGGTVGSQRLIDRGGKHVNGFGLLAPGDHDGLALGWRQGRRRRSCIQTS